MAAVVMYSGTGTLGGRRIIDHPGRVTCGIDLRFHMNSLETDLESSLSLLFGLTGQMEHHLGIIPMSMRMMNDKASDYFLDL